MELNMNVMSCFFGPLGLLGGGGGGECFYEFVFN